MQSVSLRTPHVLQASGHLALLLVPAYHDKMVVEGNRDQVLSLIVSIVHGLQLPWLIDPAQVKEEIAFWAPVFGWVWLLARS